MFPSKTWYTISGCLAVTCFVLGRKSISPERIDVPREVIRFQTREVLKYVQIKEGKENSNPSKRDETIYVPPEGRIEIQPKDKTKSIDDVLEIKRKWYGLTLQPGIQLTLLPMAVGLDFKLVYWSRLSSSLGVLHSLGSTGIVSPSVALTYHLDGLSKGWLLNTEAGVMYAPLFITPLTIGLRWNL